MELLLCFLVTSDQPRPTAQFYWPFNGGIETKLFIFLGSTKVTNTGFLKDCGITPQAGSRRHAEEVQLFSTEKLMLKCWLTPHKHTRFLEKSSSPKHTFLQMPCMFSISSGTSKQKKRLRSINRLYVFAGILTHYLFLRLHDSRRMGAFAGTGCENYIFPS